MEDVFWGWNNEVHIFDPVQLSWSEAQTHVSQFYTELDFHYRFRIVSFTKDHLNVSACSKQEPGELSTSPPFSNL